ncbi:hypothetical protein KIN20_028964 [Parelaphostrongylus tenuis]|uniref:Uncharacterized protein n=1 Tax=Parelaphostrongylus tenuis TaxID=148309 RepID=A0AAD5R1N6_PARTN|nr:hypothetical protein KIN20_028964 [Parelaphostrongylus tenuis]
MFEVRAMSSVRGYVVKTMCSTLSRPCAERRHYPVLRVDVNDGGRLDDGQSVSSSRMLYCDGREAVLTEATQLRSLVPTTAELSSTRRCFPSTAVFKGTRNDNKTAGSLIADGISSDECFGFSIYRRKVPLTTSLGTSQIKVGHFSTRSEDDRSPESRFSVIHYVGEERTRRNGLPWQQTLLGCSAPTSTQGAQRETRLRRIPAHLANGLKLASDMECRSRRNRTRVQERLEVAQNSPVGDDEESDGDGEVLQKSRQSI